MNILDRRFKYTPAARTDIRETFRRARRKLERERQQQEADAREVQAKVKPLVRGKA